MWQWPRTSLKQLSYMLNGHPDRAAEYCSECLSVCLHVCLSTIASPKLQNQPSPNFLCMLYTSVARSSFSGMVMLGTSSYMDVIFAHAMWLPDVTTQPKRSTHRFYNIFHFINLVNGRTGLFIIRQNHTMLCWIFITSCFDIMPVVHSNMKRMCS